jgi:hypothetical protein
MLKVFNFLKPEIGNRFLMFFDPYGFGRLSHRERIPTASTGSASGEGGTKKISVNPIHAYYHFIGPLGY